MTGRMYLTALFALMVATAPTVVGPNAQADGEPAAAGGWTSVGAGFLHNCGTRTDGTLWCWGYNFYGTLGDGTTISRSAPVQAGTDTTWAGVAGGTYHTCGFRTEGTIWCWGSNDYGQLGDGTHEQRVTPTQVGAATGWTTVTTGSFHSCGIQDDGSLWCWGANSDGQLGDGTQTDRPSPVQVGSDSDWVSVTGGSRHTCGIRSSGALWCWGSNHRGQLGDGTLDRRLSPVQVGSETDWQSVTTGGEHTCAIQTDQTLWCWGYNRYGQVGDGTYRNNRLSPVRVGVHGDWVSVGAGFFHSCGIRTDGTLWCWGWNLSHQLGYEPRRGHRVLPTQVGRRGGWTAPDGGRSHTCSTRANGELLCWGEDIFNQLGDGDDDFEDRARPRRVLMS